MPTLRTRTVRASGGNYTSLTGWEAGEKANLTSTDEIREAEFYDDWPTGLNDANAFNSGWTTSSTQFARLKVASGHKHVAKYDTGFYLVTTGASDILRPVTACANLEVDGLGFSGTTSQVAVNDNGGGSTLTIKNCLLWNVADKALHTILNVFNNFLIVGAGDGIYTCTNVYHNTVYGMTGTGRGLVPGTTYKNNISVNNAGVDHIGGGASSNNLTEDATGEIASRTIKQRSDLPLGAGNYVIFESTTASAQDLRLVDDAENDAINAGANLTATVPTDWQGDTRTTTPDVGADEIVAAGSTYTLTADAGSYSLTGVAAGLKAARKIAAAQGSYTLTGVAATLTYTPVGGSTYTLTAAAGSYALNGVAAGLKAARKIAAAQGTYSLTGVAAGLKAGRKVAAAAGAYTLSGKAAGFRRTYVMPAAVGSYTLTGINATLTYSNPQIWTEVSPASGTWTPVSPAGGTWTPV